MGYREGGTFQRGGWWHIRYSQNRHQIREATGIRVVADPDGKRARAFLKHRLVEIAAGKFRPQQDRLTLKTILDNLIVYYEANHARALRSTRSVLKQVRKYFHDEDCRVLDIQTPALREYIKKRKQEGGAAASIARERFRICKRRLG
jgi:hypothetical protein